MEDNSLNTKANLNENTNYNQNKPTLDFKDTLRGTKKSGPILTKSEKTIYENEDDEYLEEDDISCKILNREIIVSFTKVSKILTCEVNKLDDLDLVKFDLSFTVEGNVQYKWVVYHTPKEVEKNFDSIKDDFEDISKDRFDNWNQLDEVIKKADELEIKEEKKDKIASYYKKLFETFYRNNISCLPLTEFFNISSASFIKYNRGKKPFEGWLNKADNPKCRCNCCGSGDIWDRWVVARDDNLYYSDSSYTTTGKITFFYDKDMEIQRDGKNSILISGLLQVLSLRFHYFYERELWFEELSKIMNNYKNRVENNKYGSFSSEKRNNLVKWFIDGEHYFNELAEKLLDAKESIFITDWWLSPEVFLKRPVIEKEYTTNYEKKESKKENNLQNQKTFSPEKLTRLMDILDYKARNKVKVYILVYWECSLALTLNSKHTLEALQQLNSRIHVRRHPSDTFDLLWSHHEKLVIIDQMIGFVGGLDLCWGRFDINEHPIYEPPNNRNEYLFPLIDYSNARICDFKNVNNYLVESVSRKDTIRMPWHDVHSMIIGPATADIARHFIERWNHAIYQDKDTAARLTKIVQGYSHSKEESNKTGFINQLINNLKLETDNMDNSTSKIKNNNNNTGLEVINEVPENLEKNEEEKKPKKNIFSNLYKKNKDIDKDKENENIRKSAFNIQPSMDIKLNEEEKLRRSFLTGKIETDEDHMLIRISDADKKIEEAKQREKEIQKENGEGQSYYQKFVSKVGSVGKKRIKNLTEDIKEESKEKNLLLKNELYSKYFKEIKTTANVQALRSSSKWSAGLKRDEDSICKGYYDLIEKSQHYIFIENQFFVSRPYKEEEITKDKNPISGIVKNLIAYKIKERIIKAFNEGDKKFRVYIFIPLLPGFAGEPEGSGTLQVILKHTFAGICRNNGLSIIETLQEKMGDEWKNYIGFYSLRNHGIVNGIPKTELVYIHSKLMIIDDTKVIIGSANINDRSMRGNRDSEFAVLIKEKRSLTSVMKGDTSYKAATFAATFRRNLMAEHLGIKPDDKILIDPCSDELHNLIVQTAKTNTSIYHDLFGCYPDDCYTTFKSLKDYHFPREGPELDLLKSGYEEKKDSIKGHIVEFPLKFLEKENLGISFFSLENLVPEHNFT